MFRQLKDPDQPNDAQEGQRRARLGAFATHRGQNVEQRHVVRQHGDNVDDVLEVSPESQLRRARDEANDSLDGEPGRAGCLDEEENIEEQSKLIRNVRTACSSALSESQSYTLLVPAQLSSLITGEPGGFYEEENIEEIRHLSGDAVCHGEDGQRLDAE